MAQAYGGSNPSSSTMKFWKRLSKKQLQEQNHKEAVRLLGNPAKNPNSYQLGDSDGTKLQDDS